MIYRNVPVYLDFHLFAGDTSIFSHEQNLKGLESTLNEELDKVLSMATIKIDCH